MLDVDTKEKKLDLRATPETGSDFFSWLPHEEKIVVIEKVLSVSKDWGCVKIDTKKALSLNIFSEDQVPLEYGIEILAQSIGLVGAAQSRYGLVQRDEAKEAYVTGVKNINCFNNKFIDLSRPLFSKLKETKSIGPFKFCNVRLYYGDEEGTEVAPLIEAVLKTFSMG